jgi:ABC-type molybdate transport system substrate-binding protein
VRAVHCSEVAAALWLCRVSGPAQRDGNVMIDVRRTGVAFALALAMALPDAAQAEALKVLTAGAFKQVLLAILPQFEATGKRVQ